MTKHQKWKGSMKSLIQNHIDPQKEENLKWAKIEVENTVKRILKLTKSINHGNKEANLKKKSEAMQLIQDFQKQYESLHSLYEDLRGEVKKKLNSGDGSSAASSPVSMSDSEIYYSPEELTIKTDENQSSSSKECRDLEVSDSENTTILKDKLTSTSEVKKILEFDELEGIVKDSCVQYEEDGMRQMSKNIRELEDEVETLKLESRSFNEQQEEMEEKVLWKTNEVSQMEGEISRLEAVLRDNEIQYIERVDELEAQIDDLRHKMEDLQVQKGELEEQLLLRVKENNPVEGLMEQIDCLKEEVVSVKEQRDELEIKIRKETEEETKGLTARIHDLECEILSFNEKRSGMEQQLSASNQDTDTSELEQQAKIFELQKALTDRENEVSSKDEKFKVFENEMSTHVAFLKDQIKNFEIRLESLQNENDNLLLELEDTKNDRDQLLKDMEKEKQLSSITISTISDQRKTVMEAVDASKTPTSEVKQAQIKFSTDSKLNYQIIERKIEEMAEEFRKQFEDKYRILSRRIRVAEQIHVENKECYQKMAQENKLLKEKVGKTECGLKLVKDVSLNADDVLTSLDSVALKFEECTGNFLNRISKASCELKFSKGWAMRKNKALKNVKDDIDCLLAQLDVKEAEILVFREKLWKSENKIRELEKMIKEKEEGMVGLEEEKREAIRQLCVWNDYHRSRSDYYKKILSEMNLRSRRTS